VVPDQDAHRAEARNAYTGNVINARRHGATWDAIADACGISADTARDRWESLIERIESKA